MWAAELPLSVPAAPHELRPARASAAAMEGGCPFLPACGCQCSPPSRTLSSFLPLSLGAPLCSLLLLAPVFLALTLSFSSSPLLSLTPGRSSIKSPGGLQPSASRGAPVGSQDAVGSTQNYSHDHHECLRSPGLRGCAFLPPTAREGGKRPCTRKSFSNPAPGAGMAVPRVQSSKPYSRPTRVQ